MAKLIELNKNNLPYEKCLRYGPESLSDSELIAVILRSGTGNESCLEIADNIYRSFGNDGILGFMHLSFSALNSINGIGKVKSIMLMCIGEIARRIALARRNYPVTLNTPSDIADLFMERLRHLEKEVFVVLMLDTKCHLIHESVISEGSINHTLVSNREIFKSCLSYGAVNIILLHNHPSGDPLPSEEDMLTTQKIVDAGNIIGINVIDHIVIGDNRYFSLKEHNLM